jgi:hypothetical protein
LDNNAEFIVSTETLEDTVQAPSRQGWRIQATSIDTVGRGAPRAFKGNDDRLLGTS